MNDLISRQMLLEYIHGEPVGRLLCDKYNLDGLIKQFPSARPEKRTEERTETHACDLISRQAAIEALEKWLHGLFGITEADGTATIFKTIRKLPPIQPKRGKWIYCEDSTADCVDGYRCDQCGFFVPWDYQHKSIDYIKDYNFCPHCGADMREVTE